MRFKVLLVLGLVCLSFVASCDSESAPKYLEFATDMLLPQAAIGKDYDFSFTVTYGEDRWDENTGFVESDIIWGFSNWKLNTVEQTEGPSNMTFEDGKITGNPDPADGGLWTFDVTIEKSKKVVTQTFYLPIAQNVEIMTDAELPFAVTELPYSTYLSAKYGSSPYYWNYENWTKDGTPVNDPPVGLTFSGAGFIEGQADNSEVGDWTFDVTVFDTTVPGQLTDTKTFELRINLKLEVPTNYPTIQAAVDAGDSGQTVYLEPGTYQGAGNRNVDFGGKTLTILGDPQAPDTVIIDCENATRGFFLGSSEKNCVIDGLTIKNGTATIISSHFRGGAIYCQDNNSLTVQNCIIEDISTTSQTDYIYGGAIYIENNTTLNLTNVMFKNTKNNTQYGDYIYGNTLYATSGSKVNMDGVTITGSVSDSGYYLYGGEIYHSSVEYNYKDVTIEKGQYGTSGYRYVYGGLFYFTSCTGKFENVNIVNNDVTGNYSSYIYFYGAIGYFSSCTAEFENCVFANNTYKYLGSYSYWYSYGLFYMNSGSSKWYDCVFSQNKNLSSNTPCRYYGSIVCVYSNAAKFERCHFLMNEFDTNSYSLSTSYSYNGGGVRIYSSGSAIVNDCVFAYNKMKAGAGALSNAYSSSNMTVNNTTIYKNTGIYGGGFYNYGNLTINNCVVWDNQGSMGGDVVYNYSNTTNMNNSCYNNGGFYGMVNPVSSVTTDPYFKDTGENPVTGDCTFSDATMTVTGTPGTSAFMTEIMRGDMIFLTADGNTKALAVVKVVSDTELMVAGYYTGTPGSGPATVKKMDFNLEHTSKGDANDSPCVDSGDNSKSTSSVDIAGNTRVVDGNGNSTPTIDMGAYELQ